MLKQKNGKKKKPNSGRCCFNTRHKCYFYIPKLTVSIKWDHLIPPTNSGDGQTMFLGRFAQQLREGGREREREVAKMGVEENHTWETDIHP